MTSKSVKKYPSEHIEIFLPGLKLKSPDVADSVEYYGLFRHSSTCILFTPCNAVQIQCTVERYRVVIGN